MSSTAGGFDEAAFANLRLGMVAEVAAMAEQYNPTPEETPALSPAVLDALGRVPRHRFVPEAEREHAYQNRPLAIGHGQTISQPYIVALMTHLLALQPGHRVLEIGSGCGYQTAVLAEMGADVHSVEIVEPLARQAADTLRDLGYAHVHLRQGDGYFGWPEHAPYDAIILTAGTEQVPPPLPDQLKPGGRMLVPLGQAFATQELLLIRKDAAGNLHRREMLPVRFVPLTGDH
jgi:protein-L-isoaspartate(D-aspartate) O-methyltransferase